MKARLVIKNILFTFSLCMVLLEDLQERVACNKNLVWQLMIWGSFIWFFPKIGIFENLEDDFSNFRKIFEKPSSNFEFYLVGYVKQYLDA